MGAHSRVWAQFGTAPLAMVLVDAPAEQVYAGQAAVEGLTRRAGIPELVGSLVRDNYETIARVVGAASGRNRDPDDVHQRYDLTAAGASQFKTLAGNNVDQDIRAD